MVCEAVGCARLVGVQAYYQLGEVYRALRLAVNCFQPSLKLQAKMIMGEQVLTAKGRPPGATEG